MAERAQDTGAFWYESRDTSLYAVERGQGPALVFAHGGLADHRGSLFHLGMGASPFRQICPDLRAAGRSHYAGPLDWDLYADDLLALLEHLGLSQAIVGGSSAGSAVALRLALRHPDRVRALVLVSPVYAGDGHELTPAQKQAFARMDEAGQRARSQGIEALVPLFQALPVAIREQAVAMVRSFDAPSVAATTRFLASGVQPFESLDELARLPTPTLILPGTDPEHPAQVAARYAEQIPNARMGDPLADLLPQIESLMTAIDEGHSASG